MKSNWLKTVYKAINVVLMAGVFYFAYTYGTSLIREADFSGLDNNWWILVLAFICFVLFYIILSFHWFMICKIIDPDIKAVQALAYFASQPFKYLPSSIFSFSFRAKYAKQLGMSIKKSTYAQLLENFNILGSGLIVSVTFFVFTRSLILGILCLIVFAMAAYLSVRFKIESKVPLTKGKQTICIYKLVPSFLLITCAWVISGLSFWLVGNSLNYTIDLGLAISASAAAFVVSILAVFAPGGIGVRELTLSLFAVQNSAVIMWRLLTFTADMIVGFTAVVYIKIRLNIIKHQS